MHTLALQAIYYLLFVGSAQPHADQAHEPQIFLSGTRCPVNVVSRSLASPQGETLFDHRTHKHVICVLVAMRSRRLSTHQHLGASYNLTRITRNDEDCDSTLERRPLADQTAVRALAGRACRS